jgi:hypothetical protein
VREDVPLLLGKGRKMSALGLPAVVGDDDDGGGDSHYVQLAFASSSFASSSLGGANDEERRPSHAHNSTAFRCVAFQLARRTRPARTAH